MAWTVIMLPRAEYDIRLACDWFGHRSRGAEAKWRSKMRAVVKDLSLDPYRYPEAEEAVDLGIELRECVVGRRRGIAHRVLYTIETDTVKIHRVIHAAQDRLSEDDV